MRGDRYSRIVAWLKVILPLAALGLLSTLFLLSRVIDPTEAIPFADTEVQDRLLNQQISGPYYSGTSADGDQIAFVAEKVTSPGGLGQASQAEDVFVRIEMVGGTEIKVTSDAARVNIANDLANLIGNVVVTTSQGYVMTSQALSARVTVLNLRSPGTVLATTPGGDLVAGAMELSARESGGPAQLVFTNGVKLVYQPKQVED